MTKMTPLTIHRSSTLGTHATTENMVQFVAFALPTTKSDHSWQRLLAPPLSQLINAYASTLTDPEPSRGGASMA